MAFKLQAFFLQADVKEKCSGYSVFSALLSSNQSYTLSFLNPLVLHRVVDTHGEAQNQHLLSETHFSDAFHHRFDLFQLFTLPLGESEVNFVNVT